MNFYLIDCRNVCLDAYLSEAHRTNQTLSLILPSPGQPLPEEISLALKVYAKKLNTEPMQVKIIVEINQWHNKNQALVLLENTYELIREFLNNNIIPKSQVELAYFHNNELTPFEPYKKG